VPRRSYTGKVLTVDDYDFNCGLGDVGEEQSISCSDGLSSGGKSGVVIGVLAALMALPITSIAKRIPRLKKMSPTNL